MNNNRMHAYDRPSYDRPLSSSSSASDSSGVGIGSGVGVSSTENISGVKGKKLAILKSNAGRTYRAAGTALGSAMVKVKALVNSSSALNQAVTRKTNRSPDYQRSDSDQSQRPSSALSDIDIDLEMNSLGSGSVHSGSVDSSPTASSRSVFYVDTPLSNEEYQAKQSFEAILANVGQCIKNLEADINLKFGNDKDMVAMQELFETVESAKYGIFDPYMASISAASQFVEYPKDFMVFFKSTRKELSVLGRKLERSTSTWRANREKYMNLLATFQETHALLRQWQFSSDKESSQGYVKALKVASIAEKELMDQIGSMGSTLPIVENNGLKHSISKFGSDARTILSKVFHIREFMMDSAERMQSAYIDRATKDRVSSDSDQGKSLAEHWEKSVAQLAEWREREVPVRGAVTVALDSFSIDASVAEMYFRSMAKLLKVETRVGYAN